MSDMDGMDAFRAVLEELMDAREKIGAANESNRRTEELLRAQTTESHRLAALANQSHERKKSESEALKELWEAGEASVRASAGDSDFKRLRSALDATRDICDQPPF